MYSKQQSDALHNVLQAYVRTSHTALLRQRYELVDRYIQRTVDQRAVEMELAALADRTKIRNLEVPVVLDQLRSAHASLVGMFLTGSPIFGYAGDVSDPEARSIALMMETLSGRDQEQFGWIGEMMKVLLDALRYNVWAVEVDWDSLDTSALVPQAGKRVVVAKTTNGNRITHISPYQLIHDPSTPLSKIAREGAYVGYVRRINYIAAKQLLAKLGDDRENAILRNFNAALTSANGNTIPLYAHPIVYAPAGQMMTQDWGNFFGLFSQNSGGAQTGAFEVVTLYVRLIPAEYGLGGSKSGTPARFKMVWVGGHLVYCKPLTDAHGSFPLLIGHGQDDYLGFQTKSFVEHLRDMQDIASSLANGFLASMRRAVSDHAVYNPIFIKSEDVNSVNPAAKIPLQPAAYSQDVKNAYIPIPYEDRVGPYFQQTLGTVLSLSERVSGLNAASRGAFVKGNKTREEFNTVMSNSDANLQSYAMGLEVTLMSPLKRILKLNYMQYADVEKIMSKKLGKVVDIQPAALIASEGDFKGTDGLNPESKLVNADVLTAALNTLAQSPDLGMVYSRDKVFAAIMAAGGIDIEQYKLSPQEQQAQAAKLQAQATQPQPGVTK